LPISREEFEKLTPVDAQIFPEKVLDFLKEHREQAYTPLEIWIELNPTKLPRDRQATQVREILEELVSIRQVVCNSRDRGPYAPEYFYTVP
jgi:EAL domain-containing protein (putative c-di-GMP-specific phosphodiesterase class I)